MPPRSLYIFFALSTVVLVVSASWRCARFAACLCSVCMCVSLANARVCAYCVCLRVMCMYACVCSPCVYSACMPVMCVHACYVCACARVRIMLEAYVPLLPFDCVCFLWVRFLLVAVFCFAFRHICATVWCDCAGSLRCSFLVCLANWWLTCGSNVHLIPLSDLCFGF